VERGLDEGVAVLQLIDWQETFDRMYSESFFAALEEAEWWANSQVCVWDAGKGVREGAD
jgi:hypothetical protein